MFYILKHIYSFWKNTSKISTKNLTQVGSQFNVNVKILGRECMVKLFTCDLPPRPMPCLSDLIVKQIGTGLV